MFSWSSLLLVSDLVVVALPQLPHSYPSLWCLPSLFMPALPPTNGTHPQLLLYHPCWVQRLLGSQDLADFLLTSIFSCNVFSLLTNFSVVFPDNSTSQCYQTLQCSFPLPHFSLTLELFSWAFTKSDLTSAFKVAASPSSGFWCHFFYSLCVSEHSAFLFLIQTGIPVFLL